MESAARENTRDGGHIGGGTACDGNEHAMAGAHENTVDSAQSNERATEDGQALDNSDDLKSLGGHVSDEEGQKVKQKSRKLGVMPIYLAAMMLSLVMIVYIWYRKRGFASRIFSGNSDSLSIHYVRWAAFGTPLDLDAAAPALSEHEVTELMSCKGKAVKMTNELAECAFAPNKCIFADHHHLVDALLAGGVLKGKEGNFSTGFYHSSTRFDSADVPYTQLADAFNRLVPDRATIISRRSEVVLPAMPLNRKLFSLMLAVQPGKQLPVDSSGAMPVPSVGEFCSEHLPRLKEALRAIQSAIELIINMPGVSKESLYIPLPVPSRAQSPLITLPEHFKLAQSIAHHFLEARGSPRRLKEMLVVRGNAALSECIKPKSGPGIFGRLWGGSDLKKLIKVDDLQ